MSVSLTDAETGRALCPSGRCRPGSLLIGMVQAGGEVRLLPKPHAVTDAFVATAERGRDPLARFRFAEPCARGGCEKWGGACAVAARAVAAIEAGAGCGGPAPNCAIRPRCQWFSEYGVRACAGCRWVVTRRT